jgi:hypothetical protein
MTTLCRVIAFVLHYTTGIDLSLHQGDPTCVGIVGKIDSAHGRRIVKEIVGIRILGTRLAWSYIRLKHKGTATVR